MRKKVKLTYAIQFTGEGHPLLEKGIEEVLKTITDCIITSLPNEHETLKVTITKDPLDK